MTAINDFLLNLFTENSELRPNLMFPNLENGFVYATDCYVAIAIPENELTFKYKTADKYPNVNGLITSFENNPLDSITVKTEDIAKELTKARIETDKYLVECKECSGEGMVDFEYCASDGETHTEYDECPICDGNGKYEKESPFPCITLCAMSEDRQMIITIETLKFAPYQLYRLFMVAVIKGHNEIKMFYEKGDNSRIIAYFGGIKVLVMCMDKG